MEYEIIYDGYVDSSEINIISGIGKSAIKIGDSIKIDVKSSNTETLTISLATVKETPEGYIIWEDIPDTVTQKTSYTVEKEVSPKAFFRLKFNELTTGQYFKVIISSSNKRLIESFLVDEATMLSSTISRTSSNFSKIVNDYKSVRIKSTDTQYDNWFTSRVTASYLKWYKTNIDNYYSTFCYVKNLASADLKLYYTIQGLIRQGAEYENNNLISGTGQEVWRNILLDDSGTNTTTSGIPITIKSGQTVLLECLIRARNKNSEGDYYLSDGSLLFDNGDKDLNDEDNNGLYCAISATTIVKIDGVSTTYETTKVPFSKIFWRFDVGEKSQENSKCDFIIFNETAREGNLLDYYSNVVSRYNGGRTNQQKIII